MKTIEYRVVYAEGADEIVTVRARSINSGIRKAIARVLAEIPPGRRGQIGYEINRVEFWQVTS